MALKARNVTTSRVRWSFTNRNNCDVAGSLPSLSSAASFISVLNTAKTPLSSLHPLHIPQQTSDFISRSIQVNFVLLLFISIIYPCLLWLSKTRSTHPHNHIVYRHFMLNTTDTVEVCGYRQHIEREKTKRV